MKDQFVQYYLHQAGRGYHNGIGLSHSVPPFVQGGHGRGSFLSGLFRLVRPVLWSGVKAVGRETLCTGCKILSGLSDNTSSDVKPRHIITEHVSDLIQKLRGRGCKRAAIKLRGKPPKKKVQTTERDIFSSDISVHIRPWLRTSCQQIPRSTYLLPSLYRLRLSRR